MPRLSRAQLEARQRIVDLAGKALSPEQFSARLGAALAHAVPADGWRLFGLDPASRLICRTLAASDNDSAARREWLRDVYLADHPIVYIDFPHLMDAGISAGAYHDLAETCWGIPASLLARVEPREHWRLYHELATPLGGAIFASFGAHGRWLAALQLYRRDAGHPFRRGDVAFIQLMAPMIGQSLAAALARERAENTSAADPEPSGILLLSHTGNPRYFSPAGERWSVLLRDPGTGDDPVPTAVWSAFARLRAGHPASLVVPTTAGPVRVEASSGGEDGSVAIVLSPERPPDPPAIPAEWNLTVQEGQVAALLVQGLSNAEIAARLSSSQRTIESHLGHIYDKLDIQRRSQLVARFFQETYWPALNAVG